MQVLGDVLISQKRHCKFGGIFPQVLAEVLQGVRFYLTSTIRVPGDFMAD